MIRDLGEPHEQAVRCEVCIVGAGPAGIALSRELSGAGVDVVLLESGGMRFEAKAHDLNRGEVTDPRAHGQLEAYRRRRFGGASTSWGGRCMPFDAHDFEERRHVPWSGWPLSRRDLDPCYARAHEYCELGPYTYLVREALPPSSARHPMIPGLDADEISSDDLYLVSPPTDFAARFAGAIAASPHVRTYLHAECTRIVLNREGTAVSLVEAVSPTGGRLIVSARRFVLAAGGLEVTRLLLRSRDVHPGGLGDHAGLLGRFYMCHVIHRFEIEVRSPDVIWDYEKTSHGAYCQRTLSLRPEVQRAHGLLNHRARIEHPDIADPAHRSGVLSAAYLTKLLLTSRLAGDAAARASTLSRGVLTGEQARSPHLAAHLANVARDAASVARFGRRWLTDRVLGERQLPSIVMKRDDGVYTLRLDAEQAPNPSSRVTLGDEVDAFGQRRLKVDWRHCELDASSALRASELIGAALTRTGAGKLRSLPAFVPEATGGHHLGTTRMSADPARGVVDPNCRVHGVHNLYVASPSVFPTSSFANPMLTLLALTLRLGDHLRGQDRAVEVGRQVGAELPA